MNLREQKRLVVWRAIRSAALQLFAEEGFDAVTVEQIAAAAGVSRATFFNYFASKEAVVFDQDPEERDRWLALMTQRPAEEPLWTSLTAVLTAFSAHLADRLPLQRQLKATSPALSQSTQDFGNAFSADLQAWVTGRVRPEEAVIGTLQVNAARSALATAYQTWGPDEGAEEFVARVRRFLDVAGTGMAAPRTGDLTSPGRTSHGAARSKR